MLLIDTDVLISYLKKRKQGGMGMQKSIRKRLLCMILGITAAIGVGFAAGALTAEPVSAADTVADEKWVNYTKLDSTSCKITKFNYMAGVSPTEIIIPKEIQGLTVREIGAEAFIGSGLTKVTFASGSKVHTIGKSAFRGNSINAIDLPATISTLEDNCFYGNDGLTAMDLSKLVALDAIPGYAFAYCTKLTTVKFPESLESIGPQAFYQTRIRGRVVIPESVTSIGTYAFACSSGSNLTLDLTKHESGSISDSPWGANRAWLEWSNKNKDTSTNTVFLFNKSTGLIYGMKADAATKSYPDWNHATGALTIPSSIGGVKVQAFIEGVFATLPSTEIIKSVTFGNNHTMDTLPTMAFATIQESFSLNLPESIQTIKTRAFNQSKLSSINMPGVTVVEDAAFTGCNSLKKLTFGSGNVQSIGTTGIYCNAEEINLKQMNKDSVEGAPWGAVRAQINWKNGTTSAQSIIDKSGKWLYDPSAKVVLGYLGENGSDVDLTIPDTLTSSAGTPTEINTIGETLFQDNSIFKSVSVSSGIKTIRATAFRGAKIDKINLPDSIETIKWSAFEGTEADFSGLKLPEKIKTIESNAFKSCTFNGRVIIPGNISMVYPTAFAGTKGITSFLVKQYAAQLSDGVYDDANGKYIKSPAGVTGAAPFGVDGASVYFMDDPRPTPKYTTVIDAAANKAIVKVQGYTNNEFYTVKSMTSASGQPALANAQYPTANGKENPATADLIISSKTASGIKGGNGEYNLAYVYGNQGDSADRKNYQDKVTVNAFHTVTYNANAGGKAVSGAVPTQGDSYVNGAKATVKNQNTLAITGYTFKGWNTKADGTGTAFAANAQMTMGTVNVTLYAQWQINNVTVTLNANGGTVGGAATKAVTGNYGTQITAASGYAVPQRSGYTFLGWATTSNATAANVTTMPASNATYYAVWKVGSVAITLDANGGTVNGNATDVIAGNTGATMTLPAASAMKRDGYTFNGWFTAKTGGSRVTATVFPAASTTYYAQWTAKDNTVKFAAATGGKATTTQKTVKSGNKVGVTPAATANGGYTFTGYWNCSEGGTFSSAEVNNYVISGKNATVTFTAQFTVNGNSTVIYDCQGGVTDQGESLRVYSKPAGTAFNEELPDPKKEGYTYTWNQPKPSAYPAAGDVLIIDAVWAPEKIEVIFSVTGPGGIVTPAKITVDAGSPVGIVPTLTPADTQETKYTPTNVWDVSEGGQVTTSGIASYVISGKNKTVTFTTGFIGEPKSVTPPSNPVDKSEGQVDNLVISKTNDGDFSGSDFFRLQAVGTAKGKTAIKLKWKRVPGASKYVVYGNRCGTAYRYVKFRTTTASGLTVKKINTLKLRKGTYYKFVIVAFDSSGKSLAISKTIHVCTDGGKRGNYKSVKVSKPAKAKTTLKLGKTVKVKAKQVKGKKKVSKHRNLAYESDKPNVATVTAKGVIRAKAKGTCYIYAYAQNGVFKKIRVTVK